MMMMNNLLEKLKDRYKDRPGEAIKCPITIKKGEKEDVWMWIQPLMSDEYDMCLSKGAAYAAALQADNIPGMVEEAQAVEILWLALRDVEAHEEKLFENSAELRKLLMKDELAQMISLMNHVTYRCSNLRIVESHEDALALASGDSALLQVMQSIDLLRIIEAQQKELQKTVK